jgi:hypothetical protein
MRLRVANISGQWEGMLSSSRPLARNLQSGHLIDTDAVLSWRQIAEARSQLIGAGNAHRPEIVNLQSDDLGKGR